MFNTAGRFLILRRKIEYMKENVSLEKTLLAYRVMHTPTEFSWKQYWANETFKHDELFKCSDAEKRRFDARLEECTVTVFNSIKATTGGKIATFKDLIGIIRDPANKGLKKLDRNVVYTSSTGERPIGQKAYDVWGGFQVIDMDIKDEQWARVFKRKIFERLKKYNWFLGVAVSSSGKGLHIYTKIQIPESNETDHMKNKILYLTNFRHKYSFVYLACLKIIESEPTLSKEDILRWMDMAMFKPQQGAFIPWDDNPLISTHFFQDFIYVNFDNVEDMGHPDVDWVSHPDLKEVFKRWEWFEDDSEYEESSVDVTSAPELDIDTKNRYHYKHYERWRLANTLVKLYGADQGYRYLRMICSADIRNKELQSDCITASRHDKPIELWAVNRLNKYHGFKIKVNVDQDETTLDEIAENIDLIRDPTSLIESKNTRVFYIDRTQYLSDIRGKLMDAFGRVTLIEAGAGTGKTEMVKLLVKHGKKILLVMPFTSTIKSKVEGDSDWYYSYGNRKVKLDSSNGLAMTVDKFSHLNLMEVKESGYDYIFIDESHLLFQSEYRPVMAKVIEMVRNTEVPVVMMSGTPIGEDIFFQDLVHLKIIKEETRKKKFDVKVCETPTDSLYTMCKDMAKDIAEHRRVLFPTNKGTLYKEKIKALVQYFLESDHLIFDEPTVNYYKKSNVGEDFMNDVNFRKTIANTDILMCSTYLSVGVDILDRFEFNIYFNEIWTPQEIEQFANRLRSHDLFIRLYVASRDSEGNLENIGRYMPCNLMFSNDELKNAHAIVRICNGMIERNPIEYKYNSLVASIISNNKFIEYSDIENKYYLNEIAYKTTYFERKFRAYAQQLPVLIKGMVSYGYKYESQRTGGFKFSDTQTADDIQNVIDEASKRQKTMNSDHIWELMEMITEDRLEIYRDVMEGKYEIQKGKQWSEDVRDKVMIVKNIEVFEKVVPVFVSMSKMFEVDDIKEIFEFCRTSGGDYNFSAVKRIRMLINMVYNSKKNRLDLPIMRFMSDTYDFLEDHMVKDGYSRATYGEIAEFIGRFVQDYASRESSDTVVISKSPITIEEMTKSMMKVFRCLVNISRPNKSKQVKMSRAELLWVDRDTKSAHRKAEDESKFYALNEFLDAIRVEETDIELNSK